jgi:hypothetical protein
LILNLASTASRFAGWRETAKVFGCYAPKRRRIEPGAHGQALQAKSAALPDEARLALADGGNSTKGYALCETAAGGSTRYLIPLPPIVPQAGMLPTVQARIRPASHLNVRMVSSGCCRLQRTARAGSGK